MNRIEVEMDDLPILAFEKVLSYLSLEDRIRSRAVSRRWCKTIDSYKVKSLCYSDLPSGFVRGKNRWVSGAFAQNFISSPKFDSFFSRFDQSILSSLKHLRLCELRLNAASGPTFVHTLQSFGQLEELDLFRFCYPCLYSKLDIRLQLNLPMLKSIRFEQVNEIQKLTLDTPRLQRIKLWNWNCYLGLELVHVEPIKKLVTDRMYQAPMNELKNLNYLYSSRLEIGPTFLLPLEQLKEIHLDIDLNDPSHLEYRDNISKLFDQKQRYGRTDLKIYFRGLLLEGPADPAIDSLASFNSFEDETFGYLAENRWRLADEIPFRNALQYSAIERVAPELAIDIVNRFTDLNAIRVTERVEDIERFLHFLSGFRNIIDLQFDFEQQKLFSRLPEHCSVQKLTIWNRVPFDFRFLLGLKHLNHLLVICSMDAQLIQRVCEELEFVSSIRFRRVNRGETLVNIRHPNGYRICVGGQWTDFADLNSAIRFIGNDCMDINPPASESKKKKKHDKNCRIN